MRVLPLPVALTVLVLAASPTLGHYNMLLLSSPSVKKGEAVTLTYQWGHPYEHELFDAPAPQSLTVIAPDGKRTDLTKALEKTSVPGKDGKPVTAYRLRYTHGQRGDYFFELRTPSIWMPEDEKFLQDTAVVCLHVQAENGWDRIVLRGPLEVRPLTRPYGLQPGMVFQVETTRRDATGLGHKESDKGWLPGKDVIEAELYHAVAPKELPAEEFRTRVVRPSRSGVATCSLTEPGWWAVTVVHHYEGKQDRDGKPYPLQPRTTFCVFVDEAKKAESR